MTLTDRTMLRIHDVDVTESRFFYFMIKKNINESGRFLIVLVICAILISIIPTVIFSVFLTHKTRRALEDFSTIKHGMLRKDVVGLLANLCDTPDKISQTSDDLVQIIWPYSHRPPSFLCLSFDEGDILKSVRLTNADQIIEWDKIPEHATNFAQSDILFWIDYIFILSAFESIIFISIWVKIRNINKDMSRMILLIIFILTLIFFVLCGISRIPPVLCG